MTNVYAKLNQYLAELNIFYRKLQNYHWYIKGKDFFQVHAKLEEYYDAVNEEIDEVAEHLLMIGGSPLATLKDYLAVGKIKEASNAKVTSAEAIPAVKADFQYLLSLAKDIKAAAEKANDSATSAKMDGIIESHIKAIWMLSQWSE